jgi:hypothetical protein
MASNDDLEEHDERLKDRLIGAEFAVLNTLATIAGLFISVASLLAALSPRVPRWFFVAIVCLCSVTLLCVLLDFRFYRHAYQRIAFTPKGVLQDPSAAHAYSDQLSTEKRQARLKRRWKRRRERLCYLCLAAAIVLLLTILVTY